MREFTGTLRIRKTKKGFEHKVEFVNQKGNAVSFVVQPQARCYNDTAAADGDVAHIELEGSTITKCVIPGKEAAPVKKKPLSQNEYQNTGYGGARSQRFPPVRGCAPYNFVRYEDGLIVPPPQNAERKWSGRIICKLEALTPLLVSGKQEKGLNASSECRFMRVNGKNIIPGTSIKGMLRSYMEILSFSGLRPLSDKKLFWRTVSEQAYRVLFPENIHGGFLRKCGADYFLVPVEVEKRDADAKEEAGYEKVKTGGITIKGKKSASYFFRLPLPGERVIPINQDVVLRLRDQLTPNQESSKRWPKEKRERRLTSEPGLPVFYREEGGEIVEMGFCRYFRVSYTYTPKQLAWPDGNADSTPDIALSIFGHTQIESAKGHIAIEAFELQGREYGNDVKVVLGSPSPTCLPFYLEQDTGKIKVISEGMKNERANMNNYNNRSSRLRGHKLYWHHLPDPKFFPQGNDNEKVCVRLHPMDAGACGEFVIHVDRLTDIELGCLLEALELRPESAHKLGMAKSLGFGSVKITVQDAQISDTGQKYDSLAARLAGQPDIALDVAERQKFRAIFRDYIYNYVKDSWAREKPADFYALPPIEDFYLMVNWDKKPEPGEVRTMNLKEFANNPLLPYPEQVE